MFLCDIEIRKLIMEKKMIEDYIDLEIQLQTHGFDLTVMDVFEYVGKPIIDFDNTKRFIPRYKSMEVIIDLKGNEVWKLEKGSYLIMFNELVRLPHNIKAIGIHRSTIIRCDCLTAMGNWDTGYIGKGITRLEVGNNGLILYKNARVSQLLFLKVEKPSKLYDGIYQEERIR